MRIFRLPVFAERFSGERGDVFLRFGDGPAQRLIGGERGVEQFRLRHGKPVGGELRAVEFFREFQNRVVTAHGNVLQNCGCALLDPGVKEA